MKDVRMLFTLTFVLLLGGLACSEDPVDPQLDLPRISISDVTAFEGEGTTSFTFEIFLSKEWEETISVDYETREVSAGEEIDFTPVAGSMNFTPGERKKSLSVQVLGDEFRESDEQFKVILTQAVNASISKSEGIGTIRNDDDEVFVPEGGYITPEEYPGYNLVWSDEFDGSSINVEDWSYEIGDGCPNLCGWGNNELQYYTSRDENVSVQNGNLIISAIEEELEGSSYTSGRIITRGDQEYTFGRIDVRAILPEGQGIWPAIWMLGANQPNVGWPACGEIDIMELVGHEPSTTHGTAHWGPQGQSWSFSKSASKTLSSGKFSDEYHVFTIIWSPDKIEWYLDDELFATLIKDEVNGDYPFNQPFFFILNVAVGGNWPGNPDASTVFPQSMIIDYLRVFQKQ